ncbi:MAG TPA: type II toxin-antitoxin system death-on-curing family toxin [Streptosporangiaceae bacterium]|nr:type II toxin-antitoxin system death-on-curing family toxin [Streptosporangiaceae bacterium]
MIFLRYEHIVAMHQDITGDDAVRDPGLLESALARPQATVFGEDAYPTVWEKAAALLHSMVLNHVFLDGNKRTAWMAATVFLEANNHPLDPEFDQQAAEDLMVAVAVGECDDTKAIANELIKFASR